MKSDVSPAAAVDPLQVSWRLVGRTEPKVTSQIVSDGEVEAVYSKSYGEDSVFPFRLEPVDGRIAWAEYDRRGELVAAGKHWLAQPTEEDLRIFARLAPLVARRLEANLDKTGDEPVFLRYGDLPKGGKSRNWQTGRLEAGVSVYRAKYDPLNDVFRYDGAADAGTMIGYVLAGLEPYLVRGEVVGTGSDGEPVLRDPQILQQLRYDPDADGFRPMPNAPVQPLELQDGPEARRSARRALGTLDPDTLRARQVITEALAAKVADSDASRAQRLRNGAALLAELARGKERAAVSARRSRGGIGD